LFYEPVLQTDLLDHFELLFSFRIFLYAANKIEKKLHFVR